MRTTRLYLQDAKLSIDENITLPPEQSHYLGRVLRANINDVVHLFNGINAQEYIAHVIEISKKAVTLHITESKEMENESPLSIHIGQALVKGDKLDTIIQKATELGVKSLTPLTTERCDYRLNQEKLEKKQQHWQKIAMSAAEQSGRVFPLKIHSPCALQNWFEQGKQNYLILNPYSENKLSKLGLKSPTEIAITIGPEGGFTPEEIEAAIQCNATSVQLGPRILRTETAPIAMSAILQTLYGDF